VIAHRAQLGDVERIGRVMVGVDAGDAAHGARCS
jgi:hypothetical protein